MNIVDTTLSPFADAAKVNANFDEIVAAMAALPTSTGTGLYVSVKDHGAVGDGVAEDTVAIQDAIDSIPASGGVVWFPAGVYISGPIFLKSNITLDGEGQSVSIIKLKSAAEATLIGRFTSATNIHLRNLGFDGNKAGNLSAGHPIEFHGVTDSSIMNCAITNSRQNGLRWDGCTGNIIAYNRVSDNTFCGIRCGETGSSVHTRIIGNYTLNNAVIGISVDSVSRFIISLNQTNNNGDNGIDLCASNQSIVTSNECLSNTNQGIAIDGWTYPGKNCDDNIISHNMCMYNGQYGFDTANGNNRLIVTNNNLGNNTLGALRDTGTGVSKKISDNRGYVTENSGTVQVSSGTTSTLVTHGLSSTPQEREITLTRSSNGGNSVKYWFSNVGATTFKVNVEVDPGSGGAWFVWAISRSY